MSSHQERMSSFTNDKRQDCVESSDVDAVKRALENIGGNALKKTTNKTTNKTSIKAFNRDNAQRRRFVQDGEVIVEKHSFVSPQRRSRYFTDSNEAIKTQKQKEFSDHQNIQTQDDVIYHLDKLVSQQQKLEKLLLSMQHHIERLEVTNHVLSEKIDDLQEKNAVSSEIDSCIQDGFYEDTVEINNNEEPEPVKWWIKK
ncbi:hypothetical protein [Commensalibacter oyaizuii]|uniref:Uncharacterized protein n=1 Tax=Commensalibacter oyaizuii TaxID=3043873 RepID=A0ABT6PYK2_9PROT|nr:hypothetical protein [Commensalibacter sp. TBRC 16381]MDI2089937.1 hypothetical protein [Commensalibacter sp. TBRC 16381]